jgi:hypothetical protein
MADINNKQVRAPKFILREGDPLIDVLKPELVNVIRGDQLYAKVKPEEYDDGSDDDGTDGLGDEPEAPVSLEAPYLSDITILKKEKVRDGNGNDFVRFTINVKNHVGEAVKGVKLYGQ